MEIKCFACGKLTQVRGPQEGGATKVRCSGCGQVLDVRDSQLIHLFPDAKRKGDAWVRGQDAT
jgi:hypothetical protein